MRAAHKHVPCRGRVKATDVNRTTIPVTYVGRTGGCRGALSRQCDPGW